MHCGPGPCNSFCFYNNKDIIGDTYVQSQQFSKKYNVQSQLFFFCFFWETMFKANNLAKNRMFKVNKSRLTFFIVFALELFLHIQGKIYFYKIFISVLWRSFKNIISMQRYLLNLASIGSAWWLNKLHTKEAQRLNGQVPPPICQKPQVFRIILQAHSVEYTPQKLCSLEQSFLNSLGGHHNCACIFKD